MAVHVKQEWACTAPPNHPPRCDVGNGRDLVHQESFDLPPGEESHRRSDRSCCSGRRPESGGFDGVCWSVERPHGVSVAHVIWNHRGNNTVQRIQRWFGEQPGRMFQTSAVRSERRDRREREGELSRRRTDLQQHMAVWKTSFLKLNHRNQVDHR